MKVEKNQVYRHKKDENKYVKIIRWEEKGQTVLYYPSGYLTKINTPNFDNWELITLDNIKESEWVECKKDVGIGVRENHIFAKGKKYQVQKREGQFFGITSHLNKNEHMFNGFEEYFKPCLPHVKKETLEHQDQPKSQKPLYTNQDIMKLMEEGRFIEGDKITNKDCLTVRVSKNLKGQLGFWCRQDYVVFKQGDLWEIQWAKRWKKLSQGEIKRVIEKLAVNGQGSPGDYDDIEGEYKGDRKRLVSHLYQMSSGFDSAVSLARLICDGTWYMKEKRG